MAEFILNGDKDLVAKLLAIAASSPKLVATALYREAQVIMTESKKRVPVDLGTLKGSGVVQEPVVQGNDISVMLGYGGAASEYAFIVHEDLQAHHTVGQAKYLESALMDAAPGFGDRIAKRVLQ